jgi:hypothetical protein
MLKAFCLTLVVALAAAGTVSARMYLWEHSAFADPRKLSQRGGVCT